MVNDRVLAEKSKKFRFTAGNTYKIKFPIYGYMTGSGTGGIKVNITHWRFTCGKSTKESRQSNVSGLSIKRNIKKYPML